MNLDYYFVIIFSLNMLLSFSITLNSDQSDKEESILITMMGYAFSCGLFTLLALVYSQIAYLIQFFLPILLGYYILAVFICLAMIISFLLFSRVILNMKDHERRRIMPFLLMNVLAMLLPLGENESFSSPFYIFLITILVGFSWLLALLMSYLFQRKFQLEIPGFSAIRLPLLIVLIGVLILMLTPFTTPI